LVESSSYNANDPNSKVITRTKWATHQDYNYSVVDKCEQERTDCLSQCGGKGANCASDCNSQLSACISAGSGSVETDAIIVLNSSHQFNRPIEIQTLSQEGVSTNLLSAVVYKYSKSLGVKPTQIWGLKQILTTTAYTPSKIDANGIFKSDTKLRKLHSFDSYDASSGNLLQQTTSDGIVSTYAWGYNNSLVSAFTINPGTSALSYSYDHKPLVGLNSTTDPNLRKSYYEYDSYWRFKLSKDHEGNIVNRYRYNYAVEQNGFNDELNVSGSFSVGEQLTFSSLNDNINTGGSTYFWDFGDGTKATSAVQVYKAYASTGTYTVTLKKQNPEYPSKTLTRIIAITPLPIISICDDGPNKIDICEGISPIYGSCTQPANRTPSSSTTLKATVAGGCPPATYTYAWEYQLNGGAWQTLGTDAQVEAPIGFITRKIGNYNVRCRITDGCGRQVTSTTILLAIFKTTNC